MHRMATVTWLSLTLLLASQCVVRASILCEDSLQFGETYSLSVDLTSPRSVCYHLDNPTKNKALRVFAGCEDAHNQQPVLVTVRQSRAVTSWSIPFVESGYAYTSVHRILCPLLNIDDAPGNSSILVDLSTSSTRTLNFTLRVSIVMQYKLELNKPEELVASPSSPSYMLFEYPEDQSRVKVRVTSNEESVNICSIASIQNVYCPVVELLDNPEDRGKYQTMRSLAAFNVEKHSRRSRYGFFYVVLSVFPHNGRYGDCDYTESAFVEMVSLDQVMHNYNATQYSGSQRVKRVTVTVEPALPSSYLWPMSVALGCLLLFYLIAGFWISYFDWWQYDRHPMYKDLKEKARAFITDITTPFDDYDGVDARLVDPRPPLRSFRGLRKRQVTTDSSQQTATDVTHSSMQLTDHRLSSSSNGIAERQTETRPPLESTGGLEARQEIPTFVSGSSNSLGAPQESTRPATLELRSRREAMAAELPSSRPTFLSVLAGIHWRKAASRAHASSHVSTEVPPLWSADSVFEERSRVAGGPPLPPTSSTPHISPSPSQQRLSSEEDTIADAGREEWESELGEITYKHDTPTFPVKVLLSELGRFDEHQRVFDYYPVYLLVVGTFYALPVFQLLVTYRQLMASGNENICYYNFLCSHPLNLWGFPLSAFNNLFSNVAFFTLGLLLILIVYRRRQLYCCYVELNFDLPRAERVGVPQQFGIYYAIGVAMMGQAILSVAYHMCPTRDNFRFDSTFMYVQSGLGIHKLLQSRTPDKDPGLHEIMLLLTALLVAVVIETISDTSLVFWLLFCTAYLLVTVVFALENYYRWQISLKWEGVAKLMSFYLEEGFFPPRHKPKFMLALTTILLNTLIGITGLILRPSKFAVYVLFLLLINFLLYLLYYILTKLWYGELKLCNSSKAIMFAFLSLLFWGMAVVFFAMDPTEWNLSPSLSRDQNQDCLLMGFYDSHDIWHFLSGFAVFFSSMLLMTLDDRQEIVTRDKIMTF